VYEGYTSNDRYYNLSGSDLDRHLMFEAATMAKQINDAINGAAKQKPINKREVENALRETIENNPRETDKGEIIDTLEKLYDWLDEKWYLIGFWEILGTFAEGKEGVLFGDEEGASAARIIEINAYGITTLNETYSWDEALDIAIEHRLDQELPGDHSGEASMIYA